MVGPIAIIMRKELIHQVDFACPGLLGSYKQFNKHYEKPITRSREVGASAETVENGKMKAEEVSRGLCVSLSMSEQKLIIVARQVVEGVRPSPYS